MSWASLEALATTVAALTAVIAIWLQNKSFKANLTADLAMKLDDRFALPELKEIRSRAARALKNHIDEEDAEDVFDFFETIGLFTRRKALDAEVVHSLFFHWINVYWTAGMPYISRRQRESKFLWKDFGYLYQLVLAVEIKDDPSSQDLSLSPEDLERYLDDEIALRPSDSQMSKDRQ